MEIAIWIGIGILAALATVAGFFARREFVSRGGGTIEVSLRLSTMVSGRGWAPGYARFDGDELRWYRMFSLWIGPRRTLYRKGLTVLSRRIPEGPERLVLPDGWVILRCVARRSRANAGGAASASAESRPVEIAMAEPTVTGFLSWLESAPPGTVSHRLAA